MKNISGGRTGEELRQFLLDNSDTNVKMGYTHTFTEEEIVAKKEAFWQVSKKLASLEDEEKARKEAHKETVKPLMNAKAELFSEIKFGNTYVRDAICYKLFDYDTSMVEIYNPQGIMVERRPIDPNDPTETQYRITPTVRIAG